MSARLLIVDDEPQIGRMLRTVLTAHGYMPLIVSDGRAALEAVASWHPDLVLLDLGLPGLDGMEVCRQLRGWSQVPIIVLTVREHEQDKVAALDAGADDYLTKPFSTNELLARIRVALRHAARFSNTGEPIYSFGRLQIDRMRRLVTIGGQEIHLTPTEYELLCLLVANAGKVLTHRHILRTIWGAASEQDMPTLRVFMTQLRRKIEPDPAHPSYIVTEPGIGYRFQG